MSHYWSGGDFVLPTHDHPWLRADALIETIKSVDGTAYFLTRHMNRLSGAIGDLHMKAANILTIKSRVAELVRKDKFSLGRVRLTYFSNGDYLITHEPLAISILNEENATRLSVSKFPRYSESALYGYKTMSYTEASFGQRLANETGCDDLLYLNEKGEITESGFANVLLEINGRLITPARESGVLNGVVRDLLLNWFPQIEEGILNHSVLAQASGLYLLSSIREIELISEVKDGADSYRYDMSDQVRSLKSEYQKRSKSQPDS